VSPCDCGDRFEERHSRRGTEAVSAGSPAVTTTVEESRTAFGETVPAGFGPPLDAIVAVWFPGGQREIFLG
jgi:hypothetical protein